jgi:inorganic pyrophosphatase
MYHHHSPSFCFITKTIVLKFCYFVFHSSNITIQKSPGFIRREDPDYASLPHDSRKPPAPIDPSGEPIYFLRVYSLTLTFVTFPSVSKWFYISSVQV